MTLFLLLSFYFYPLISLPLRKSSLQLGPANERSAPRPRRLPCGIGWLVWRSKMAPWTGDWKRSACWGPNSNADKVPDFQLFWVFWLGWSILHCGFQPWCTSRRIRWKGSKVQWDGTWSNNWLGLKHNSLTTQDSSVPYFLALFQV